MEQPATTPPASTPPAPTAQTTASSSSAPSTAASVPAGSAAADRTKSLKQLVQNICFYQQLYRHQHPQQHQLRPRLASDWTALHFYLRQIRRHLESMLPAHLGQSCRSVSRPAQEEHLRHQVRLYRRNLHSQRQTWTRRSSIQHQRILTGQSGILLKILTTGSSIQ